MNCTSIAPATDKKTRKLTDAEVTARFKCGCPHCGSPLKDVIRMKEDDRGKKRFAGTFFGCSKFGRGCTAKYSLSVKSSGGVEGNWQVEEAAAEAV